MGSRLSMRLKSLTRLRCAVWLYLLMPFQGLIQATLDAQPQSFPVLCVLRVSVVYLGDRFEPQRYEGHRETRPLSES